jgi:hypothetical protein
VGKTVPSFFGCCKTNPCTTGTCPPKDLKAAFLNAQPAGYAIFAGNSTVGSSTETTLPTKAPRKAHKVPVAPIAVGITIGTILCVLLVIIIFLMIRRRRQLKRHKEETHKHQLDSVDTPSPGMPQSPVQLSAEPKPAEAHPSSGPIFEMEGSPREQRTEELPVEERRAELDGTTSASATLVPSPLEGSPQEQRVSELPVKDRQAGSEGRPPVTPTLGFSSMEGPPQEQRTSDLPAEGRRTELELVSPLPSTLVPSPMR